MKPLATIVLVVSFLFCQLTVAHARDQRALEDRLSYLKDLPEVGWVRFDGNTVYVGFKKRPADLASIVGAAAFHGNKAYGFGVHVWAVPANNPNWKVGDTYYCEATGRYGKVEDNSCR